MAGREVPKVKISKKKFDDMLDYFDITYGELGTFPGVDRTGSAISKNVSNGEMPTYTAMAIAEALDVNLGVFARSNLRDRDISAFVRMLTPKQMKRLYSYLGRIIQDE